MGGANSTVSSIAAYLIQGTAANVSKVSGTSGKNTSGAASSSFDSILNKVSGSMIHTKTVDASKLLNNQLAGANETLNSDNKSANIKQTDVADNQDARAYKTDDNSQDLKTTIISEKETDTELQQAINEAGEEIISRIADSFEVSEDEIVNAMQILGLMASDLLNPANISQLLTEITGQEETIDLITDSDIYTSLQDLMEGAESMKSELMNEFDLSEDELQTAIQDSKSGFGGMLEEAKENLSTESEEYSIGQSVSRSEAVKNDAPVSEAFEKEAPAEEKQVVVETEGSKSQDNKGNLQNGEQSINLFNQVMNNIADAAVEAADSSYSSYVDRTQMEDIIKQITDKITISTNQQETSMELALHPANLGHVNILLTSGKDGIVAKFTAQNEIVKEAVESQMAQLQQKFNEQGIKVTSVEVTIASHEFEQNLDQQGDRQPREAQEGKKIKGLRRINLSELPDDKEEEISSEAEKIAVQMMEANGNTVDFSA